MRVLVLLLLCLPVVAQESITETVYAGYRSESWISWPEMVWHERTVLSFATRNDLTEIEEGGHYCWVLEEIGQEPVCGTVTSKTLWNDVWWIWATVN